MNITIQILVALTAIALTGCKPLELALELPPQTRETQTAAPQPTSTATPRPTSTATPKPSPTATPKPSSTATPLPTSTTTPLPQPTFTTPVVLDGISGLVPQPAPAPKTMSSCPGLTDTPNQWQKINPPGVVYTGAFMTDPFNAGTVWLFACGSGSDCPNTAGGLYRSDQCGNTGSWTYVTDPKNKGTETAAVNASMVWTMQLDYATQGTMYFSSYYGVNGIWKSTDSGVNWKQLQPGMGDPWGDKSPATWSLLGGTSMDPTNSKHLLVIPHFECGTPNNKQCLSETFDGGDTWTIRDLNRSSHVFYDPNGSHLAEQSGPWLLNDTNWLFTSLANGMSLVSQQGTTSSWFDIDTGKLGASGVGYGGGQWQTEPLRPSESGSFYLPANAPGGLLTSTDLAHWKRVEGAPQLSYEDFTMGGGRLFIGDEYSRVVYWADESNPKVWHALPAFTSDQGSHFIKYDPIHHVLYSTNWQGGMWRIYIP